jgi:O-antigen ligase
MSALAYACLWLFVFSLPWEPLTASGGVAIVTRVTGAIAVAAALGLMLVGGRVRRWHLFHLAALLFVLWAGFGLLVNQGLETIPKKFYTYLQLFLVLLMIWEMAPQRRRLLGLMLAYVLGGYISSVQTILLYIREHNELQRFAAVGDPNDLAMALALALPMAWYLAMTHRRPVVRWVCGIYVPICVVSIGLTGSRGGMLATIVALMIAPLTMVRLSPGRRAVAIFVLIISGALAVAYLPETVIARLATTGSEFEGDLSIGGRYKLWVAGLYAFLDRPIIGYGPGAFKPAIMPQLGRLAQVAHNSYISVLVEEGLVGFVLYGFMILTVWMAIRRLPTLDRRFARVLLATLAVAMLPLTWEDHKAVWFILATLLGLARADPVPLQAAYRQFRSWQSVPAGPPRPAPRPLATPVGRMPNRDARA